MADWSSTLASVLPPDAVPAPEAIIAEAARRRLATDPTLAGIFGTSASRIERVPFLAPDTRDVPRLHVAHDSTPDEIRGPGRTIQRRVRVVFRVLFSQQWWKPMAGGIPADPDAEWVTTSTPVGIETLEALIYSRLRGDEHLLTVVNGQQIKLAEGGVPDDRRGAEFGPFGTAFPFEDPTVAEGYVARDLVADYPVMIYATTGKIVGVQDAEG